jgi:hypothetical protein
VKKNGYQLAGLDVLMFFEAYLFDGKRKQNSKINHKADDNQGLRGL